MKKALKIYLFVAFAALTVMANAQIYRLEAGYNNPHRGGKKVSSTYFQGIKLGGTAELELQNNFSFLTGMLYNAAYSYKVQGYPSSAKVTYETYAHFVDIPLQVYYTLPLFKKFKAFGFAGPTINMGLAQNLEIKSTQTYDPLNPLQAPLYVKPGKYNAYTGSDHQLNRINLQLGVGGGLQWKTYQLKSGYDFGLNNLNKTNPENAYQKGWYVTATYEF